MRNEEWEWEWAGVDGIELMPKMMMISRHKHIDICTNMCIRFRFISVFIAAQAAAAALVAVVVVVVVVAVALVVAVAVAVVAVASRQLVLIAPRLARGARVSCKIQERYKYDKSILWHPSHLIVFCSPMHLTSALEKHLHATSGSFIT